MVICWLKHRLMVPIHMHACLISTNTQDHILATANLGTQESAGAAQHMRWLLEHP